MTEILLQLKGMDSSQYTVTDEKGNDVPVIPANPILQQQGGVTSTASLTLEEPQRVIKIERKLSKHHWPIDTRLEENDRYLLGHNNAVFEASVLEVAKDHLFVKTTTGSFWMALELFKESVLEKLKDKPQIQLTIDEKEAIVEKILEKIGLKSLGGVTKL